MLNEALWHEGAWGSGGEAQRVLDRSIKMKLIGQPHDVVALPAWEELQVTRRQEVQLATQLKKTQKSLSPPTIATRPSADHNTDKT